MRKTALYCTVLYRLVGGMLEDSCAGDRPDFYRTERRGGEAGGKGAVWPCVGHLQGGGGGEVGDSGGAGD